MTLSVSKQEAARNLLIQYLEAQCRLKDPDLPADFHWNYPYDEVTPDSSPRGFVFVPQIQGQQNARMGIIPTQRELMLKFHIAVADTASESGLNIAHRFIEGWTEAIALGSERSPNGVAIMETVRRNQISGTYEGVTVQGAFAGCTFQGTEVALKQNQDKGANAVIIFRYSYQDLGV